MQVSRVGQVQAIDGQTQQSKTIGEGVIAVMGCCVTRRRTLNTFRPGFASEPVRNFV